MGDIYVTDEIIVSQFHDEYDQENDIYIHTSRRDTYCIDFKKSAVDVDKGLVSGWANVAKNADGTYPVDYQGDIIEPSMLEDAAIEFMKEYRESGVNHDGNPAVGVVVESLVFTKEKQAALGIPDSTVPEGWFITVKINDPEVFAKVKSGEYEMFSIQGEAVREPVAI